MEALFTLALALADPKPAASPAFDCKRTGVTHATGGSGGRPQRLVELPPAWKLQAVNRRVNGCAVHPEARRIADRTGRPAEPRSPR